MVDRNKHFCSSTTTTETNKVSMNFCSVIRGVSRTAATSKIELFVIIVNGFQQGKRGVTFFSREGGGYSFYVTNKVKSETFNDKECS